ncbi:MAG: M20 family metallopeptidase [Bacillota bacterium]
MKYYPEVIGLLNEEKAVEFLQEVIKLNTTNPPGQEKALAQLIADKLEQHGINSTVDDLGNNRGNVIASIKGSKEKKTLFLNGHLDVVPPGEIPWKYDPFAAVIEDGKLFGRGASDMKGGLAALVIAMCLISEAGVSLKGDLLFAGSAGEEVDCLGAIDLLNKGYLQDVGAAVIAEPSNLKIFSATKGALWLEFTAQGKTSHGSMPQYGNNAILQINGLVNELTNYRFKYQQHNLLGNPTINIATIKGGVKTNVVPDSCVLTVDIRTVPGQSHQEIIQDIFAILEQLKYEFPGFDVKLKILNNHEAVETTKESPFLQLGIKTAQEVLGLHIETQGVNYYTDASVFIPTLGIPVIIFGPGDEKLAHQPDEYVEVSKYIDSIKYYTALILNYLT